MNIRFDIAYDGTDFHGFARQRDLRTVQGTLETTLQRVLGREVEVYGSGRTDAGVHARAQVVNFEQDVGPPPARYSGLMARMLPRDVVVIRADEVPSDFHARFSAVRKTYRYTLQCAAVEDVFTRRFAWHVPYTLDLDTMRLAAQVLIGEHDFTSFCAASTPAENKVRTVFDIDIRARDTYLDVYCTGSGFLQYMVRIIVGTLVDVSLGRMTVDTVARALSARDRRCAGRTAPPHGLTLWNVEYPDSWE